MKPNWNKMIHSVTQMVVALSIFTGSILTVASAQATEDWFAPWRYRKTITISRSLAANTTQTNFPVLIRRMADADLATHARADGADLVVTAADGITPLASEVERFDLATGELIMWIRIPLLSTVNNTFVHLYYGNPAATTPTSSMDVWDDDYIGVWHKNDASPTSIADSTSSGLSGLKEGGMNQPVEVPGKIGMAQDYASTNASTGIKITCDGSPLSSGSFSFWGMNYLHVTNDMGGTALRINGPDFLHVFVGAPGDWDDFFVLNWGKFYTDYGTHYLNPLKIRPNLWFHLAVVWEGDQLRSYIDGALNLPQTLRRIPEFTPTALNLGRNPSSSKSWNGVIDEFRLSRAVRSADWIATEYRTQNEPERYVGFGPQRAQPRTDWSGAWAFRKQITISHTAVKNSDQTNFPVLVTIEADADLAAQAQASGNDLLVTAEDGITFLSHEIEYFDATTGALVLWVNVPVLSTTVDTILYLYYGNATASDQQYAINVWDDNYVGVWHKNDASATHIHDSTIHACHGIKQGSLLPMETDGKIGKAQDYTPSPDRDRRVHIQREGTSVTPGTISLWVKNQLSVTNDLGGFVFDMRGGDEVVVNVGTPGSYDDYWLLRFGRLGGADLKAYGMNKSGLNPNQWHQLTLTWQNDTNAQVSVFQNGVFQNTVSWTRPLAINPTDLYLGNYRNGKTAWYGAIDEVRLSDVVRSADWIATEYALQNSPADYVTLGPQKHKSSGTIVILR